MSRSDGSRWHCRASATKQLGKTIYILVICDGTTRYPEAVTPHNIDVNTVAEELLSCFPLVGVPEEILMDQGTNFTS